MSLFSVFIQAVMLFLLYRTHSTVHGSNALQTLVFILPIEMPRLPLLEFLIILVYIPFDIEFILIHIQINNAYVENR